MSVHGSGGRLKVIIIGGGIGGLTAALSLFDVGINVEVFEQAPSFTAIGAGIQVSPNAARVFLHLGLGGALSKVGVLPFRLESRSYEDGRLLGTHDMNGDPPAYGAPHYLLHRADLLDCLVDAIPEGVVQLSKRVIDATQDADSATVHFDDGTSATGDLVVAADGIHSHSRSSLFGEDQPEFSGTVAYRGIVPAEKVIDLEIPNTSTKWWGPVTDHHLVHYFLSGGSVVNVAGIVPEEWRTESWTAKGDMADFKKAFEDFAWPIPQLIDAIDHEVYKFAIYDRSPLPVWTVGRVTLLGDAAHPMVPYMAQGAAMAIEDAAVLARVLKDASSANLSEALGDYDRTRRHRTDRMQAGSRGDNSATWRSREWIYGFDVYSEPLLD